MLDLGGDELHGHRQPRRGQDFLGKMIENLLRRHLVFDPLAHGAEEIRLLDVFLAVENVGHIGIISITMENCTRLVSGEW